MCPKVPVPQRRTPTLNRSSLKAMRPDTLENTSGLSWERQFQRDGRLPCRAGELGGKGNRKVNKSKPSSPSFGDSSREGPMLMCGQPRGDGQR